MGFGPQVKQVENTSQASPMAGDLLKVLQGQLSQGAFGTGVGPLQRESGTAIRQFMNSGAGNFDINRFMPGGGPTFDANAVRDVSFTPAAQRFDFGRAVGDLQSLSRQNTNRSVADMREGMGMSGARFGTPGGMAEGSMRADAGNQLAVTIGNLIQAQDQSARENAAMDLSASQARTNRDLAVQGGNLQAGQLQLQQGQTAAGVFDQNTARFFESLKMMQGFGNENIAPFLQLAAMGILPKELFAQPGVGQQLLQGLLGLGTGVASAFAGKK